MYVLVHSKTIHASQTLFTGNSKGYTHTQTHTHTHTHSHTYADAYCNILLLLYNVHMSKIKEQHIPNKILSHPYAFHAVFTFSVVLYYYIMFYSYVKFANAVDVFHFCKVVRHRHVGNQNDYVPK